jgi:hypothetical protein
MINTVFIEDPFCSEAAPVTQKTWERPLWEGPPVACQRGLRSCSSNGAVIQPEQGAIIQYAAGMSTGESA